VAAAVAVGAADLATTAEGAALFFGAALPPVEAF
jgi:hypothetical protein